MRTISVDVRHNGHHNCRRRGDRNGRRNGHQNYRRCGDRNGRRSICNNRSCQGNNTSQHDFRSFFRDSHTYYFDEPIHSLG